MDLRRRPRPANLAKKLRQIRQILGLSQSELVRQLDPEEKMHYGRISEFELGKREPSLRVLLAYARVAGLHMEVLVDDNIDLPHKLPGDVIYPGSPRFTARGK
ncbi:MAG TPA: helix-turn-helix transcriptional regulator [Pyrinomonadaceae bacterium]|nr:helix-turn-helix transcriptional regulator [Pyrinomonadaceae bacterium]